MLRMEETGFRHVALLEILTKQSHTAGRAIGEHLTTPHYKIQHVTKFCTRLRDYYLSNMTLLQSVN
jgi:hypothetical protein